MVRLPALRRRREPYEAAIGRLSVHFMCLPSVYALRQFDAVCKTALNRVRVARRLAGTNDSVGRSAYASRSGVVALVQILVCLSSPLPLAKSPWLACVAHRFCNYASTAHRHSTATAACKSHRSQNRAHTASQLVLQTACAARHRRDDAASSRPRPHKARRAGHGRHSCSGISRLLRE